IDHITTCLRTLQGGVRELDHAFLVGGFSNCVMLQEAVRAELTGLNVLATMRPEMAIVKGAVLFAGRPMVFNTRKARLTYGVSCLSEYRDDDLEHVQRKATVRGPMGPSDTLYIPIFSSLLRRGDDVPWDGGCVNHGYFPIESDQSRISFKVLASHKRDIQFPDKDKHFILGNFDVPVNMCAPFGERGVRVEMRFGGPELLVTCFEEKTE
ncbi:unnamed protein product, partial [Discosporangium mesarthrocarpum]